MEGSDQSARESFDSPPSRVFRHYKSSDNCNSNTNIEISEDDLNITKTELSMFYRAAQRMTERVTATDTILKTRAMRDQEKLSLMKKYPIVCLQEV